MNRYRRAASAALIVGLSLALFYPVLRWLFIEWLGNDYYSHGPLVLLISAFFAWRLAIRQPARPVAGAVTQLPGLFSALGLFVLVLALGVYLYALLQWAYFVAALAMIALIAGLVWYLLGTAMLKRMAFPILFLVFMVPLPFVEPLSVPLAQFTGSIAAASLRFFGVPVTVNGAQISLPTAQLVVGAQCSGLRSIVTLLTLVAVVIFVVQGPWWAKAVLAVSSLPIAALGNVLRVASLLMVANVWGADAGFKYYHDYSGIAFFLSAFVLLLLFSRVVGCREIREDIF